MNPSRRRFAALLALPAFLAAAPAPVRVKLTTYATPLESDFGGEAVDAVRWISPLDGSFHVSRFAPGFAGRDSVDPIRPDVSGVAMEGAGLIDPSLHAFDAALRPLLRRGYVYLVLQRWDAKKRRALMTLAKAPLAADGEPLVPGVSAAARDGDPLFPRGRRVRLVCGGRPFGERLVHDECSSCGIDAQLDLYVAASTAPAAVPGECDAFLLP